MKLIIHMAALVWIVFISGCGKEDKPAQAEHRVLKTQLDTLNEARKVDRVVLDAAEKRREDIDKMAQ